MSVVIEPVSVIVKNLGLENGGNAHAFFTERCKNYMDQFTPRLDGHLRGETGSVDVQADKIIYELPYASYQYYGEREDGSHKVKNYTTPGTGPYWDRRMVSAYMKTITDEVEEYIRKYGRL